MVHQWQMENLEFLLKLYKNSKRQLGVLSEIDKQSRRALRKSLLERSKTPESVVDKQIRHVKDKKLLEMMNFNQSQSDLNTITPTSGFNRTKSSLLKLKVINNIVGIEKLDSQPLTSINTNSVMSKRLNGKKNRISRNSLSKKHSNDDRSPIFDIRKSYHPLPVNKTPRPEMLSHNNPNQTELIDVISKFKLKIKESKQTELNKRNINMTSNEGVIAVSMPQINLKQKNYINSLKVQNQSSGIFNVKEKLLINKQNKIQDLSEYYNNKKLLSKVPSKTPIPRIEDDQLQYQSNSLNKKQKDNIDMVVV